MIIICVRNLANPYPANYQTVTEDNGWITLYPDGREENPNLFLHAVQMATSGTVGAYVVKSYSNAGDSILTNFASASSRAWTLQELRDDNTQLATRLKAMWRNSDRINGQVAILRTMMIS